MKKDPAGIIHCWETTQLLRAWERPVQLEASQKAKELFPNINQADIAVPQHDTSGADDEEAGDLGVPFTHSDGS